MAISESQEGMENPYTREITEGEIDQYLHEHAERGELSFFRVDRRHDGYPFLDSHTYYVSPNATPLTPPTFEALNARAMGLFHDDPRWERSRAWWDTGSFGLIYPTLTAELWKGTIRTVVEGDLELLKQRGIIPHERVVKRKIDLTIIPHRELFELYNSYLQEMSRNLSDEQRLLLESLGGHVVPAIFDKLQKGEDLHEYFGISRKGYLVGQFLK